MQLPQPDPDDAGPAQKLPLTELSYDAQVLCSVMLPDGSTRHSDYDATSGQLTGQTDELGHQTPVYTYNEASGQVATSGRSWAGRTRPDGQTDDLLTTYTYTQASADPDDPPSGLVRP